MTRKHFRALAEAIAQIKDDEDKENTANSIGQVCAEQNKLFDWSRWLKACKCENASIYN